MVLTKQQRIYFAVLGIAASAWAVDRFVLRGGVTAPAGAQASTLLITRAGALAAAAPTENQRAAEVSLADRLGNYSAKMQEGAPARDIFAPPESWVPEVKAVAGPAPAAVAISEALADFRQSHALTAVIRAGRNSQIFMGSRIVGLGEQVEGFRLVSVSASTATFDYRGAKVSLELADAPTGPSPGQTVARKAN